MNNSVLNKRLFLFFLAGLLVLGGSNLLTYRFASRSAQVEGEQAEQTTIIQYQPQSSENDRETTVLDETIEIIASYYYTPVEKEQLVEGALRGMVLSLEDPQVQFYDAEELEEFLEDSRGSYSGIGIRVIEVNERIIIFEAFSGSPAERSGLTPGDMLLEADGNELTGQGISRAVELLRGPSGTSVEVKILRPGADMPLVLNVNRAEINIATVHSEMIEDGLGYIRIDSFDSTTFVEFSDLFRQMESAGLREGLILDLRNNPGGLVDQAVEVAKMLVPEGEIVRLVGRDGEVQDIYYSSASKKPYPIVVLINEDSASSAELLAGALQDRGAALLVGKTSYGKASVQQLAQLSNGNAILLTMARYFTPSGHDIHEHGIVPDFDVDMPEILRYYRYFLPGELEQDDFGPDVEMLQMMLEELGYRAKVTGYFDLNTSLALSRFQEDAGLSASGRFDDQTWVVLRDALDRVSRENDGQLNFALDLLEKPGLWSVTEGALE